MKKKPALLATLKYLDGQKCQYGAPNLKKRGPTATGAVGRLVISWGNKYNVGKRGRDIRIISKHYSFRQTESVHYPPPFLSLFISSLSCGTLWDSYEEPSTPAIRWRGNSLGRRLFCFPIGPPSWLSRQCLSVSWRG